MDIRSAPTQRMTVMGAKEENEEEGEAVSPSKKINACAHSAGPTDMNKNMENMDDPM